MGSRPTGRGWGGGVALRGPVDRLTAGLPHPWPTIIDWVVTIVVAVAAVLAIKEWVVNPYRIPSSSMEPTLHCAAPAPGCLARFSDRVLANRFIYRFRDPERGEIVVFKTPPAAASCLEGGGAGQTFVKRLIGLPGDRLVQKNGILRVNGEPYEEPYIEPQRRGGRDFSAVVPAGQYFMMGDNRAQSCDSREWGAVPRNNLIGPVFAVYWPPQRIGFR
jgi:signal peptidase I